MGACLRGKVSAWRGDHAATVRHLERAARCADQLDWADPGVRGRLDILLAEAYVAVGRPGDARRISAWLRELGERLGRPALTGDAHRIDALVAAAAGDLDAAAESARAAVTAHGSSPLRLELARSLLVLGQIERRRKARGQSRDALRRAHELATEMGHRPLLAADRTGAAAGRGGTVRQRADRDRAAGRRPDRGRRDQPGRRGGAVRQRADHRDARRVHLPQARRAHPGRAGPAARRASVVLRIPRPAGPPGRGEYPCAQRICSAPAVRSVEDERADLPDSDAKEPSMSTVLAAPPTTILMPGDPGWDDARRAWNLAVDQHPAAVALPESAHDVAAAVRFAREHGLRVAAQGTGHNARPLGSLDDTVLVKTARMRRVTIDPAARIARAEAGAVWHEVVEAAAEHGLAALAGSSPDVGVVGYTIGGGISWLGRAYGLAANNVEAIEVVTADGRLVRADACTEPDLFWALRGGGGSFGVVTAIELRLFPITEVYAGLLWWPAEAAAEVLQAWRDLTQSDPPEEFTSAAAVMRFPAIPDVPGHLRGRSFAIIDRHPPGRPGRGRRAARAAAGPGAGHRHGPDDPGGRTPAAAHGPRPPGPQRGRLAHARQPARRGDRGVRPLPSAPRPARPLLAVELHPRRRRDEAGPAGQRRAGRDRRRLCPVRGGHGADRAGRLGGRVRGRGRAYRHAARGRPGRCTSTSPTPAATRPASGPRRPTTGSAASRPRSTPTT